MKKDPTIPERIHLALFSHDQFLQRGLREFGVLYGERFSVHNGVELLNAKRLNRCCRELDLLLLSSTSIRRYTTNLRLRVSFLSQLASLRVKIVVLGTGDRRQDFYHATLVGAVGCVSLAENLETLADSLQRIHETSPPSHAAKAAPSEKTFAYELSLRESQILHYAAQGFSNSRLASRLLVSINVIKYDLQSLFRKLGAIDRTHAVVIGLKRGHLTLGELEQG